MSCVPASAGASTPTPSSEPIEGRALGSVFGGVHVNPNVDVFAGGTYSTQENYRDGTGYEVANTGNRLSAGIGKITVRPADGHEIKLGTIYQEDLFSVGQPPRRAGDPNSTNPNGTNSLGGTSIYKTNLQNYTTTRGWKYPQARRQAVRLGRQGLLEPDGQRPGQDFHTSTTPNAAYCGPGIPGNAGVGLHRQPPRLSARYRRLRRSQHLALRSRGLAQRHHLRRRCLPGQGDHQRHAAAPRRSPRPAAGARFPAASCSGRRTTQRCSRSVSALRYDNYKLESRHDDIGRRPAVAEDHDRPDADGDRDALYQLCRRLPRAVDHRDAGQRSACRRHRAGLVLPLSVGYAGARRRLHLLLRAQSEPAARGRQEQGNRLQRQAERHLRCRPTASAASSTTSSTMCPITSIWSITVRHPVPAGPPGTRLHCQAVLPVSEHCPGPDPGFRSRDDVRRRLVVRAVLPRRFMHGKNIADGCRAVQHSAAEDHDEGRLTSSSTSSSSFRSCTRKRSGQHRHSGELSAGDVL